MRLKAEKNQGRPIAGEKEEARMPLRSGRWLGKDRSRYRKNESATTKKEASISPKVSYRRAGPFIKNAKKQNGTGGR